MKLPNPVVVVVVVVVVVIQLQRKSIHWKCLFFINLLYLLCRKTTCKYTTLKYNMPKQKNRINNTQSVYRYVSSEQLTNIKQSEVDANNVQLKVHLNALMDTFGCQRPVISLNMVIIYHITTAWPGYLYIIHKYLRQFILSYWSRGHHMGCLNGCYNTSKKCFNMGATRDIAPVLIRQFIHSYWSRATAGTPGPHLAHLNLLIRSFHERALPFHS